MQLKRQSTEWHAHIYNAVKGIIHEENKRNPVSDRTIAEMIPLRDKVLVRVTPYMISKKRKELGLGTSYERRIHNPTNKG